MGTHDPDRWLIRGDDGRTRCWWPGDDAQYVRYHDVEWGRPVSDDRRLFEKVCLEGFQAGLSWLTILRKRENFRAAFDDFDVARVARYGPAEIERLLGDAGIVRHRGKIEATINNARRLEELLEEFPSFAAYVWTWSDDTPTPPADDAPVPSVTPASTAMSKDLRRRGWRFVGPTTTYAFFQAMGLVNDHVEGCEWRDICEAERDGFSRP